MLPPDRTRLAHRQRGLCHTVSFREGRGCAHPKRASIKESAGEPVVASLRFGFVHVPLGGFRVDLPKGFAERHSKQFGSCVGEGARQLLWQLG